MGKRVVSFLLLLVVIGIFGLLVYHIEIPTIPSTQSTTTPEPVPTVETTATVMPTVMPTVTPTPATRLELHQINVGCGDAYLIKSDNLAIMVDGGEKDSNSGGKGVRQRVLNYLEKAGITHLDAYIATHWHGDHVENMYAILNEFGTEDTIVYGNSSKLPSGYSIPFGKGTYVQMIDGNAFTFGNTVIKCMGPYKLFNSENMNSLNFLITHKDVKMLMTGDYVHKEILDKYKDELENIEVFKAAHHGLKVSDYSGSRAVLPTLNPKVVLVSANSSGPLRSVLANQGINASVYDNKNGNIVVISDGEKIRVNTDK